MERQRITLDNPIFKGNLRYDRRSVTYRPRPLQPSTIDDIVVARTPKPKHPLRPAAAMHTPKIKLAAAPVAAQPRPARPEPAIKQVLETQSYQPARRHGLRLPQLTLRSSGLYGLAIIVFIIGITVSLSGLRTNHQVAAQVKQLQKKTVDSSGDAAAPSTQKPSAAVVGSYAVAPNLPRYIDIAKLGVHARVLSLGVTKSGAMATPNNVYDAGWYNASAQPGQPGAMVVDGHISSWTTKGVFYGLNKLVAGDAVTVTRGDGQKFTYTVVSTQTVAVKDVDTNDLLVSKNTAKPGLSMISCAGDVIPGTNEFDKRVIVYAVMQ